MDNKKTFKIEEKTTKADKDTEHRIFEAARKIFHLKGLDGARMQEIADEAGINKAMLHYYFRSKDKLFGSIFEEDFKEFFKRLAELISADLPLLEKIEFFVENYLELILQNSYIPAFILSEIHHNPERIKNIFLEKGIKAEQIFVDDIKTAISLGIIRPIDPKQLIVNIIGLCIFPIVAKPILCTMLSFDEEGYRNFIEERKKEVARFVINSIKIN
ncbi:MAG TPA: TetR/AcrR family transcriptional regulator [Ignavibacteria bacterium]|nr:TetR/AcrR family transcriptional regulator [Ignavibacteria bacterium]